MGALARAWDGSVGGRWSRGGPEKVQNRVQDKAQKGSWWAQDKVGGGEVECEKRTHCGHM